MSKELKEDLRILKEVLDRITYFYYKTTGKFEYPNSSEGDIIRIMHKALPTAITLIETIQQKDKEPEIPKELYEKFFKSASHKTAYDYGFIMGKQQFAKELYNG